MRQKRKKNYFTKETEQAIIKYNKYVQKEKELIEILDYEEEEISDSKKFLEKELFSLKNKKDKIFKEKIEFPLNKLVENIINRFKFAYFYDTTENIQREVVSFLITILHKYKEEKGRAFSYFSVVTKRYLILENRAKYDYIKSHLSTNSEEGFNIVDNVVTINNKKSESKEFSNLMLEFWENNLTTIFKKEKDIKVADSIMELFRRSENIENFNKKNLYIMIREMTGVKTQYITNVVNKMREHVFRMLKEYRQNGIFNTDNIENDFFI